MKMNLILCSSGKRNIRLKIEEQMKNWILYPCPHRLGFVLCSTLGVFSKKEFLSLEAAIELKSA